MAICVITNECPYNFEPLFTMGDGSKESSLDIESPSLRTLKDIIFIFI